MTFKELKFRDTRETFIGGVPAILTRISFSGELGYEIYVAPQFLLKLFEEIESNGRNLGLKLYGSRALMSLRLEKNWGVWTMDFRPDFTAVESGLDAFINWDKNFIGKESALSEKKQGPKKKLVTMTVDTLDIDVTNADAWNLKSLVYYERKSYGRALDCADKAIDSDPTFGMAWYNRACYLSMLNQVPESLDALVRSIEIDVKNAKRAVKDKDFMNVRLEEGFKRIVEVVVIESLRQGYHTIGSIVWTTFLDKEDVLKCLERLMKRGLAVKHEIRKVWSTIDTYDLVPEIANKIGTTKRGMLGIPRRSLPKPVKSLKNLAEAIQLIRTSIEQEELEKSIEYCNLFINPEKCGQEMIDEFLEEHREIRLLKVRLKEKGLDFLQDNKRKIESMFDDMEVSVTKKLRSDLAQN